jgi:Mn2+/Fe2+ NRAMP family transporter
MFISNLVMFFIILTCGAVLFPAGIEIETAEQAALALQPLAGNQAYILFALGIIGTGLLAIPVLAGSAGYALAETFRWSAGLNKGLSHARAFYGVIIIGMFIGLGINFIGMNPIKALIYSAIFNGITAPIILYFIVKLSSDKSLMGRWVNGRLAQTFGYLVIVLMTVSAIGAIIAFL